MQWLFLVHQIQTTNSRERVKIWRLTKKVGAILYRNSVYVLPYSKERLEDFQWLSQQIKDSKGEASVFVSESNDETENKIIVALFVENRERDYQSLLKSAATLEKRLREVRPVAVSASLVRNTSKELKVLMDGYHALQRIDFFSSPIATKAKTTLDRIQAMKSIIGTPLQNTKVAVKSKKDFRGKTWATREHIHVDRVCSAWLIRRFIDPKAKFVFASETRLPKNTIPFDMLGVEFSHHGDDCTFETLLKSFQIKDKALREIAEIVHDIDLKDGKFKRSEVDGIDTIVRALSDLTGNDRKMLEVGCFLLDALYQHFSK
jgi:hypothetical protein